MTQFKKNLMKNRLWLLLFIIVLFSVSVTAAQNKLVVIPLFGDEQSDIEALKARIAILEAKLVYMSIESGTVNGLSGPHVIFTGANVHIRSGSDSTDDNGALKGLGNLIVGYNEERSSINDRTGSHNIVVGAKNNFSSYGGLVVGYSNTISGSFASVCAGDNNTASGNWATVCGGDSNTASGYWSSVSGGYSNTASGADASVSGGFNNTASGVDASVSGGYSNTASGDWASVTGGTENEAAGENSTALGWEDVTASNKGNILPYPCDDVGGWCK
jgi:hypothetical protein